MITNSESGTNIQEVAPDVYRINTPVTYPDGTRFSFNQYLVVDDAPLLFHAGMVKLFPWVRQAIDKVMPATRLRHIAISHFESDEAGALNEWLKLAPEAQAVCSQIGAMVSLNDFAIREPRSLKHNEELTLGRHVMRWQDTPHVPHGWDAGFMFDVSTSTLFCGDLFTQPGHGEEALTHADILGPSEEFRKPMDYWTHAPDTVIQLNRLADLKPTTLACMHGSAWKGDASELLRHLGDALTAKS